MADAPSSGSTPATPAPLFSPLQRRIVGYASTFLSLAIIGYLLVLVFSGTLGLLAVFSGVLWPLITAGIMALVLMPVVHQLETRLKLRRVFAVVVIFGGFLLVAAGGLFTILPPVIRQLLDFVTTLPDVWKNAYAYTQTHYPQWADLANRYLENPKIKDIVEKLSREASSLAFLAVPSLKAAGLGALTVFGFFTSVAVIPIYLFFFLISSGDPTRHLGEQLPFLKPAVREDVVFLVREFISIVVSFFRGQLIIGLIMGVLLAIAFTIAGLKFGLFIGLMLGVLNIVPYLGTIIGLSVALPLAFFQPEGGPSLLLAVIGSFCVVQMIEGWYLTPKIMGDRTGLHPVTIIVAIFFWGTALGGILGMILAIPLTAFFVTAWRLLKRKYLGALAEHPHAPSTP
jgi:predicted PurR-regulated permease PerM